MIERADGEVLQAYGFGVGKVLGMGLKLRYNLFYANAEDVCSAFASFYGRRGSKLRVAAEGTGTLRVHCQQNGWVIVDEDSGWDWKVRREAQLAVSHSLWCPGFLVFVYDGDYWGYEFFDHGRVLDHFLQEETGQPIGFPGADCRGSPNVVAEHLPFLSVSDIAPYLVQKNDWVIPPGADVPARSGDEFRRFEECAVIDFLRMLGVGIDRRDGHVRPQSPVFRAFRVGHASEQQLRTQI